MKFKVNDKVIFIYRPTDIAIGVIRYVDNCDHTYAIEVLKKVKWEFGGLHSCCGHVPSGRGWWVGDRRKIYKLSPDALFKLALEVL